MTDSTAIPPTNTPRPEPDATSATPLSTELLTQPGAAVSDDRPVAHASSAERSRWNRELRFMLVVLAHGQVVRERVAEVEVGQDRTGSQNMVRHRDFIVREAQNHS